MPGGEKKTSVEGHPLKDLWESEVHGGQPNLYGQGSHGNCGGHWVGRVSDIPLPRGPCTGSAGEQNHGRSRGLNKEIFSRGFYGSGVVLLGY